MPNGKKKSAVAIFEQGQRQQSPRKSAVDIFESEQAPPPARPIQPQAEPPGFLENLGIGAKRTLLSAADAGRVLEDAIGAASSGDFGPLGQVAELAGRGLFQLVTEPLVKGAPSVSDQSQQIAAIRQQQTARIEAQPELYAKEARAERERLNARAALDPSIAGKATRGIAHGVTAAVPAVVAGVATGGSLPAIGAVTGLQTLDQPENLALNVAASVAPLPGGKLVAPILRRIRGVKAAPEIPGIAAETGLPSRSLAKAIGQDAFDDARVAVEDLGLSSVPQPTRPNGAFPVRRDIPVDSITLSRDKLSRGRMFQAEQGLKQGLKEEGETFTTLGGKQRPVDPIHVVPDPANPGRFIVEGDGNHRVALLKLQGNKELIPVKSFETPSQSGAVEEATAALTQNYYRPPMALPTLEEAPIEPYGVSLGKARPSKPGAVGPRIDQYGFVEGQNPGIVKPEEKDGFLQTLGALFKAGLLTRPNTHAKNLGYNLGFAMSEEAARVPGAIADIALSAVTGQRTFTGLSPGAIGRSAREAATKGLSEAWQIIKKGVSDADAERLALKELNSNSKIINTYVKYIFRTLNAEDKVFNAYATRRALEDRARSVALTEIRAGQLNRGQYGQRVRELVENPTEQLAADAKLDAEFATFTNPNRLAKQITNFKEGLGPGGEFVGELVVPFPKTPTNVIAQLLNYTPLGLTKPNTAKLAINILKRAEITPEMQRQFAQRFGRASTGSALIGLGWLLYKGGMLTGFREDDPTRRARDEASGRIPGAILVGDTWHQVVGTSPFGNLMVIGATIGRETDQERDDALGAFLEAPAQFVGEQPLMAGAQQIASALKQPGSFVDKTLGGIASGFVPGIVSDVAQTIDPTRRQADTFLGRIENRIPGLKNTLPEKPDVLGRSVPLPFPFDPTKSTTAQQTTNPLLRELVRLDKGISAFEKKKDETQAEYADKVRTFGQLYGQYGLSLINSPSYNSVNDVAKQEIFDIFSDRLKTLITENEERYAPAKLNPPDLLTAFRESQLRKQQKRNQR